MRMINVVPIKKRNQVISFVQVIGAFILVAISIPLIAIALTIMNMWQSLVRNGYYERR